MKVFGLGLSKTGTTTLRQALEILGYRVAPKSGLSKDVARGRLGSAFARIEQYDAFEDMPWPLMFEPIFERYGTGAKYILTVRRSPELWLNSFKTNSLLKDPFKKLRKRIKTYGRRYPFGFEAEFRQYYQRHNERVRTFFRERGVQSSLLEMCWDNGDGWKGLCAHLGHDIPDRPFPHENVTRRRKWRYDRHYANAVLAYLIAYSQGRRIEDRIFAHPDKW